MKSTNPFWIKYLHCQNKRQQQEMCQSTSASLTVGSGARGQNPENAAGPGSPLPRVHDSRWQNIWRRQQRRCLCKVGEGAALERDVSTASPGWHQQGDARGGGAGTLSG